MLVDPLSEEFINPGQIPKSLYAEHVAWLNARLTGYRVEHQPPTVAPTEGLTQPRGWTTALIERAVTESVHPLTAALDLLTSVPGRWFTSNELREATGLTRSDPQLPGMFGAFKNRAITEYARSDTFMDARKERGQWSYRLSPEAAEIVRRARETM